jgi:hypothetical protein
MFWRGFGTRHSRRSLPLDQGQEVFSSPSDEMDVARSTADADAHASLIESEDVPLERLKALPFALLCVDCQQKRGKSRGRWGAGGTMEPYGSTWTPPADMEAANQQPNSYAVIDSADRHAEDPFGPIDEPTGEEPNRRRGRPRKNKDG